MELKIFCCLTIALGTLVRALVSVHSYSGQTTPPMYGDFEAQRHWQEVTLNLPIGDWYENTTDNNLLYWGLDYPPLTAYHSLAIGFVGHHLNNSYTALHTSRGITTAEHKHFMRSTVLLADLIIYLPGLAWAWAIFWHQAKIQRMECFAHLFVSIFYPGQILIDNGHFQYNNISLGLAALSFCCLCKLKMEFGAALFVLALNYKQMELYHALPVFFYLLAHCFGVNQRINLTEQIKRFGTLAAIVVFLFSLIWLPWILTHVKALQVLHRIFPLARGIFEDKVSNIWCMVNVAFPLKKHFSNNIMAMFSLTCTLISILPSCVHLFMRPNKNTFILSLINTSLAFFLFSYQVHEKSILLVTLPVIFYFPDDPIICLWFLHMATFSMIPLLLRDGLLLAYIALNLLLLLSLRILAVIYTSKNDATQFAFDIFKINCFIGITQQNQRMQDSWRKIFLSLFYLSMMGALTLLMATLFVTPPSQWPFIFSLIISAYCCIHFLFFLLYFNNKQFHS